jgi:hypothetical protein
MDSVTYLEKQALHASKSQKGQWTTWSGRQSVAHTLHSMEAMVSSCSAVPFNKVIFIFIFLTMSTLEIPRQILKQVVDDFIVDGLFIHRFQDVKV